MLRIRTVITGDSSGLGTIPTDPIQYKAILFESIALYVRIKV